MSAAQDTPAENILTEFIVLGIHALEMDEELVFFVVLDEVFFADFVPIGVLDELFQIVNDSNDFGQTNDSKLADSGLGGIGGIWANLSH